MLAGDLPLRLSPGTPTQARGVRVSRPAASELVTLAASA
jgi:hypothetical protein